MKVTVCEIPNGWSDAEDGWLDFSEKIRNEKSDLILLPEMPFARWLAGTNHSDPVQWQSAVAAHARWISRLSEFGTPIVIGTRPVLQGSLRQNQGFVWDSESGLCAAHTKYYLPDEEGFWEASWYQRGDGLFDIVEVQGLRIGFLICTELWFNAHARAYASEGIHLLVCPRATPHTSVDKWIVAGRTAAVVAGAFCLSSNFNGPNVNGMAFGGTGWIIEPESGCILGLTTPEHDVLTLDINPAEADQAKTTYPRYVED